MHAFEALDGVQEFLLRRILQAVDPSIAGEVRAAIKILAGAASELRTLGPLLKVEWQELHGLRREAANQLGDAKDATEQAPWPDDLLTCLEMRRALDADIAQTLVRLQELAEVSSPDQTAVRHLVCKFYETLERHSAARASWQSVFPHFEVKTNDPGT